MYRLGSINTTSTSSSIPHLARNRPPRPDSSTARCRFFIQPISSSSASRSCKAKGEEDPRLAAQGLEEYGFLSLIPSAHPSRLVIMPNAKLI
jgi:hypothetical protein